MIFALLLSYAPCLLSACCPQNALGDVRVDCKLRVLSLNLHGVRDSNAILRALREAGAFDQADLMLFQEVGLPLGSQPAVVDRLAQSLGMQAFFASTFSLRNGDREGLAVLSRYPIVERRVISLRRYNLRWKSRIRIALALEVDTPAGRIRVYNLHLDTRLNLKDRLAQLKPVAEEAAAAPEPVLVGGDFNTNPYRWFQHTLPLLVAPDQGSGVVKYMKRLGFSSVLPRKTPTSDWLRMQLDWIFLRDLRADRVDVRPIKFSDHHVLYACLVPASKAEEASIRRTTADLP